MHFQPRLAGLALAALSPVLAQATTIPQTFNFYGNGPLLEQASRTPLFKSGSMALEVSAKTSAGVANVILSNTGLGVEGRLLANAIDGDTADTLTLSFNQTVKLSSISLSYWDNDFLFIKGDRATLSWGNKTITLGEGSYSGSSGLLYSTFALDAVGQTFTLKASAGSSFRLAGIVATPAVPEPGTWALMGLGMLGMATVARRRKTH